MSALPDSWLTCKLGDVISYSATQKAEPTEIPDDAWVLELEDIEKDTSKVLQRLTFKQRQSKSTKSRFETGDILYGKLRPYLNKVVRADQDGYCTTEIIPIKPSEIVEGSYLIHWLMTPTFIDYVTSVSHGLSMPRLGTEAGKQAPFILAPINEQKRIADKLDAVLARVDACRDRLDRIPTILKRFRQSVLSSATSGKLTESWRIETKINSGKMAYLGDLGQILAGQSPSVAEVNHEGKGEPYVTGPEQWDGKKILAHKWTEYPKRMAPDGSIFVTVKGAGVGKTFPGCRAAIGRDVYAFVPDSNHDHRFVLLAIQSYVGGIVIKAKGLIPGLTKADIAEHEIYLPVIEEQTEIVRRVESLFAYADRFEARHQVARAQVEKLTPATLAKAFRGELVPQNPNDEPASVLLQRIHAQRDNKPRARK